MNKEESKNCIEGACDEVHPKGWGDGPWEHEPNRIDFSHAGFPCFIHRNMHVTGSWCGYVGITSRKHPAYGKHYDRLDKINVHGGLTFSDRCEGHICHPSKERVWWLGLDFAHLDDYMPRLVHSSYELERHNLLLRPIRRGRVRKSGPAQSGSKERWATEPESNAASAIVYDAFSDYPLDQENIWGIPFQSKEKGQSPPQSLSLLESKRAVGREDTETNSALLKSEAKASRTWFGGEIQDERVRKRFSPPETGSSLPPPYAPQIVGSKQNIVAYKTLSGNLIQEHYWTAPEAIAETKRLAKQLQKFRGNQLVPSRRLKWRKPQNRKRLMAAFKKQYSL